MTAFKILFFLLVICLCGFNTSNCLDAVKSLILTHRDMVKRAVTDKSGFTTEEATGIVDRHNELRTSEQSSDMLNITWNSALETNAQTHAAKCNFTHSTGEFRSNVGGFSYAGENIYASSGTSLNVTIIVDYWYSEKSDYNYDTNTCTKVCGHYTQVVWANSTAIGCGVQFCPVLDSSSMNNSYFVVCQYGPGY
ncbi:glioma pathogenesis-related protein 1-like [Biomphalaria glabrata]|uniref:Glioma pathogenesis-related protein 1-like n=1 Tax=Biomphalaria glabrata TaxID=6526 RepID=A0A9W3ASW6_BIOGL|nr:glioma pathogenesis-related protein 1-like [Biomphalaria glabrata]